MLGHCKPGCVCICKLGYIGSQEICKGKSENGYQLTGQINPTDGTESWLVLQDRVNYRRM